MYFYKKKIEAIQLAMTSMSTISSAFLVKEWDVLPSFSPLLDKSWSYNKSITDLEECVEHLNPYSFHNLPKNLSTLSHGNPL